MDEFPSFLQELSENRIEMRNKVNFGEDPLYISLVPYISLEYCLGYCHYWRYCQETIHESIVAPHPHSRRPFSIRGLTIKWDFEGVTFSTGGLTICVKIKQETTAYLDC